MGSAVAVNRTGEFQAVFGARSCEVRNDVTPVARTMRTTPLTI